MSCARTSQKGGVTQSSFLAGFRLGCSSIPVFIKRFDFGLLLGGDGATVRDLGAVRRLRIASAQSTQAHEQQPKRSQGQPSKMGRMHKELLSTSRQVSQECHSCVFVGPATAIGAEEHQIKSLAYARAVYYRLDNEECLIVLSRFREKNRPTSDSPRRLEDRCQEIRPTGNFRSCSNAS
jgi:hypothetical protein